MRVEDMQIDLLNYRPIFIAPKGMHTPVLEPLV